MKTFVVITVLIGVALATTKICPSCHRPEPSPCSSDYYHQYGKCGLAEHGYLRCQKGFWCSQHGYCGKRPEYQRKALCPEETRPDRFPLQYRTAPNDEKKQSETSYYEEPSKPYYEEPSKPNYEEPSKPYYEEPSKPYYEEPSKPYYEEPSKPYYEEPSKPYYEEPSKPYYGYCGTSHVYKLNAICPEERRKDETPMQYRPAPNNDVYKKERNARQKFWNACFGWLHRKKHDRRRRLHQPKDERKRYPVPDSYEPGKSKSYLQKKVLNQY